MAKKSAHLVTVEEYQVGSEDRVFFAHRDHEGSIPVTAGWYWQARGSADCYGPFESREAAEADYESC